MRAAEDFPVEIFEVSQKGCRAAESDDQTLRFDSSVPVEEILVGTTRSRTRRTIRAYSKPLRLPIPRRIGHLSRGSAEQLRRRDSQWVEFAFLENNREVSDVEGKTVHA